MCFTNDDYTVKQWERMMKPAKMTFFLGLERNDGSCQYIELNDLTCEEAENLTEDAYKYMNFRAVYLFDAYCRECMTVGSHICCDHPLDPATHLDFIHCRIDVNEVKRGVEL